MRTQIKHLVSIMTTPQELKAIVSEGLLSFPLTDFDKNGDFRADTFAERLE